jgi:AraC family ethanolamine operon transcriptional activator
MLQVNLKFENFEEFAQSVLGWNLDFQQLDHGHFKADLHQIQGPNILITKAEFNRNLMQRGEAPQGMRTFGIMSEVSTPSIWRKQEMNPNRIVIFPKDSELESASLAGFEIYTVSVSEKYIEERLCQEESTSLSAKFNNGGVLTCAPEKIQRLSHFLGQLTSDLEANPDCLQGQSSQHQLREDLMDQIVDVMYFGEQRSMTIPFRKRALIMKRIESWAMESEPENQSVQGLCQTLKISERTLRRIFHEWYGVSPKQYLVSLRLNGVRKEIYQADPLNTNIADIANNWGFWHMGSFAGFYRRQFGELPSETLKNRYNQQSFP